MYKGTSLEFMKDQRNTHVANVTKILVPTTIWRYIHQEFMRRNAILVKIVIRPLPQNNQDQTSSMSLYKKHVNRETLNRKLKDYNNKKHMST